MPDLSFKDDYILRFACGRRNTAILTKYGELWIAGNFKYDMNKILKKELNSANNEDDNSEEAKFKKEVLKGNKNKKNKVHKHKSKKMPLDGEYEDFVESLDHNNKIKSKHKETRHNAIKKKQHQEYVREERKKVQEMDKSLKHKWVNFTHVFGYSENGKKYKIDSIELGIQNFAVIVSHRNELIYPLEKIGEKKKGVKLMVIQEVIPKINKSSRFDLCDFTVIYQDRFEGNLECPLDYFYESTDIPYHRVKMLKLKDEVVWDRKNKIDKLNLR